MYTTSHELVAGADESRRHVGGLKEPPAPLSLHDTLAEGKLGEAAVSFTDAVTVTFPPEVTVVEFAEIAVCVAC